MTDVKRCALALGDTKEQIIATLRAMGVKGPLSNAYDSPFGRYLTLKMDNGIRYGAYISDISGKSYEILLRRKDHPELMPFYDAVNHTCGLRSVYYYLEK